MPSAELDVAPAAIEDREGSTRWRGPRWPPSLAAVAGAGLVLWGGYIGLAPLRDNSFLTHLATGRLILADGRVPTADPYTFTAHGEPWVVQSWLASTLYASIERVGGGDAIRVLTAVLIVSLVGVIWTLTRPAESLLPRLVIGATAVGVGALTWSPRPLMIGLVCLALTLLVLERRWVSWPLLPLFWLWVNTHGSFPIGLLVIAVLAAGSHLDHRPAKRIWEALLWALGGVALSTLNPLGPSLVLFPLRLVQQQEAFQNIVEWQSPDFGTSLGRLFLLQIVLAIGALARRPSWRHGLLLAVALGSALLASRNVAVASILLVPGMAHGARGLGSISGTARSRFTGVAAVALAVVGLISAVTLLQGPAFRLSAYPVDAVAYLDGSGLLDEESRVMAVDYAGNYLELVRGDEANVSHDDRVDMFPAGVSKDYLVVQGGRSGIEAVLERWRPTVVVWTRGSAAANFLAGSPEWRMVYSDDKWIAAVPR